MARQALKNTQETGIKSKMFFIYGHPTETLKEAMMTLRFIKKNRIDKPAVSVCSIYPLTEVERFAWAHGILPSDFSWSKPFFRPQDKKDFNASPFIPKLIQPTLGRQNLKDLYFQSYVENISLSFLKRKFSEIGTKKGIKFSSIKAYESLKFFLRTRMTSL